VMMPRAKERRWWQGSC